MKLYKIFPREILEIIWDFLPEKSKAFVTKTYYEKYHKLYIYPLLKPRFNSYIRFVIRNNYLFLMEQNLIDHYETWIKLYNWSYKQETYTTYIHYLLTASIEYNSQSIINLLRETIKKKSKINKKQLNQNKTITQKYNTWSN